MENEINENPVAPFNNNDDQDPIQIESDIEEVSSKGGDGDGELSDSDVEFLEMITHIGRDDASAKESGSTRKRKYYERIGTLYSTYRDKPEVVTYEITRCPQGFHHVKFSIEPQVFGEKRNANNSGEPAKKLPKPSEQHDQSYDDDSDRDEEKKASAEDTNKRESAEASTSTKRKKKDRHDPFRNEDERNLRTFLVATKPRDPRPRMKQERLRNWLNERHLIRRLSRKLYTDDCTHPYCQKHSQNTEHREGKKKTYKVTKDLSDIRDLKVFYDDLEMRAEFSESSDDDDTDYDHEITVEIARRYYIVSEENA